MNKEELLAWILKRWGIPADAATIDVIGAMHVAYSEAHGYRTYIVTHKCEDKQGEIARLTTQNDKLRQQETATKEFVAAMKAYKMATADWQNPTRSVQDVSILYSKYRDARHALCLAVEES